MRTNEEYRQILQLWEQGTPKKRIGRLRGIPKETVRDCISRYQSVAGLEAVRVKYPNTPDTLRRLQSSEATMHQSLREGDVTSLGQFIGPKA